MTKALVIISFALAAAAGMMLVWFDHGGREEVLTFDGRYMDDVLWRVAHPATAPNLPSMPPVAPGAYGWIPQTRFFPIAHGLGSDRPNDINTLLAFRRSYAAGFRLFEVDISVTRDNQLICRHDTPDVDEDNFSFADFVAENRRLGKKGNCVFADLIHAVSAHPDIYIILDVKNRFNDAYRLMRQMIGGSGLGRRFIPQLYDFSELPTFRRDGFFAGPIFTSYRSQYTTRQIMAYARQYDLPVVTLSDWRLRRLPPGDTVLRSRIVFGHPMDNLAGAKKWKAWGLRAIYTFTLSPSRAPSLYQDALSQL
jgi:glycerophosphoryl diester phosphodiesterase